MDITRATHIMNKMCKDRYTSFEDGITKILSEFTKYQVNGECNHFWPDENTACRMFIEQRNVGV